MKPLGCAPAGAFPRLLRSQKSPGWPVVYVGKDLQTVEGVPRSDISGSDT